MAAITIYATRESSRLRYVLDWVFTDILHVSYELVTDENELKGMSFFISYGADFPNALSIPDAGLLWENEIKTHDISIGEWRKIPTLYQESASAHTLPFDLLSAVFFLIVRYEEYYPHTSDKHGRYPVAESLLYKNNWLQRPLIDEWLYEFYHLLKEKNIPVHLTQFSYTPTYDIDMAYSYKHKGLRRTIGGFTKSILKGDFAAVAERRKVLLTNALDPFDSFVFIKHIHSAYNLKPVYFILTAIQTSRFDKNIDPYEEAMQKIIRRISKDGIIALHPSYYSEDEAVFEKEKRTLQQIAGTKIDRSRQHYLKMKLPDTYRMLIKKGMRHDYTMGYGNALGFRAGTGRSFPWFDLEQNKATQLTVHPFCFMDTTAHFEEQLSLEDAFLILNTMKNTLQSTSSKLITIFHNFSLGTDRKWNGWNDMYELFASSF